VTSLPESASPASMRSPAPYGPDSLPG
jgi:hypothetical protein